MLRSNLSILLLLLSLSQFAQTDSTAAVKPAASDTTTKKKEPIVIRTDSSSSEIMTLAPSVVKTNTASTTIAPPAEKKKMAEVPPPAMGEVFKPKISIGAGMMSFQGDLYSKHYQAPWTARTGFDLSISQQLFRAFQLNFNILFGKLGANEWLDKRQQNFQSEIRSGGISLLYDFGNFIPDRYKIRPWVSFGVSSFEFLSKTDLYDNKGNKYYYWSDGSIKNMAEGSQGSQFAIDLVRDYRYETDLRELNADGFGKYRERAWAFPVGAGALMKITDRVDLKIGFQYYFTTTDYIDGITSKSIGNRAGKRGNDNFVYTSFSLQYDLVFKQSEFDTLPANYFDDVNWLALDLGDYDEDGVPDPKDKCHCTEKGVKVDSLGCPLDDDKDGVANHEDDELKTPAGSEVNRFGVAYTDDYWQDWYNHYGDSAFAYVVREVVPNFYDKNKRRIILEPEKGRSRERGYTVELARYSGSVPKDEMTKLLSIGDMKSTTLPDGQTVVYTSGVYKDVNNAVKRRDQLQDNGNNAAHLAMIKDGDVTPLTDDDVKRMQEEAAAAVAAAKAKASENAANGNNPDGGNNNGRNPNDSLGTTTPPDSSAAPQEEVNTFVQGAIVYRVQLGAYRNRISRSIFHNVGDIIELRTDDGLFHYVTQGYHTIQEAAEQRANLVLDGYADAFVTAYQGAKRITMSQAGATVMSAEKENLDDKAAFSSVNKDLISFKVQLGALRKPGDTSFEEKVKDLKDLDKQMTSNGSLRYTTGDFHVFGEANKYRQTLSDEGYTEAFVIAIFKGQVISIEEALELLK